MAKAKMTTKNFKNPHTLMVQGTTSDAGKSILATALCRILARQKISVAPFKSQNMALNSAVTADGGEIGRAQAVQAEACYLLPDILMNPVLLKPNSDVGSQVIVNGKSIGNMKAQEYHQYKPQLLKTVVAAYDQLAEAYHAVIVEGAGSPAEINLREHDIANMGFAEAVDCPVIIVADIDRGGVFAHLFGTYELLRDTEKARVVGFVINRFRGDVSLLESGLSWLEDKTTVPVLAVIPYIQDLHIEAEDSISQNQTLQQVGSEINIAIINYPRTSNHTDFDVLRMHPQVHCEFVKEVGRFDGADLIILPGSKNVRGDLQWLRDSGWTNVIDKHLRYGGKLLGVCGGYQMLGEMIHDPEAIESAAGSSEGLGYLAMETRLADNKTLRNVSGTHMASDAPVCGYEIHAGVSSGAALDSPLFSLIAEGETESFNDGAINADNSVMGSYVHGLLDETRLLAEILQWSGLDKATDFDYLAYRQQQIDRLADAVEAAMPLDQLKGLLSLPIDSDEGKVW
ncbi:MAG: adenosylcobyric acid synthase [Oceanicoccus sp.]|jgi:adenosylcobyric acid synthase